MAQTGDHLFGLTWRHRSDGTRARTFGVRQGDDRRGVILLELTDHQGSLLHDHPPAPARTFSYADEAAVRAEWEETGG